jgi:response regulator RpfG family c-di-GMP phosphodiesterase
MPLDKAFDIIEESKGEHFDPQIAQVFLELRPQIEEYLAATEQ